MVTRERKEETCQRYDMFLRIIDKLGHGMMLQKQFIEICILLNAAADNFVVIKVLKELEESEIIKKVNFMDTKNKFIILKKYAIKYLTGADSSTAVASVKKPNSNLKYYDSIFRLHFILFFIIPSMIRMKKIIDIDNLLKYLYSINCNVLYTKNSGLDYYISCLSKFSSESFFDKKAYDVDVSILKEEKKLVLNNLNGISRESNKQRKKRVDFLSFSTVNTLLKKDVYIGSLYKKDNIIHVSVYDFDIQNGQNSATIALNINITYALLKRLFGEGNFNLKYMVVAHTNIAQKNLERELNKTGINPITHKPREKEYWKEVISNDGVNHFGERCFDYISLKIINFDIENNYQNGLKKVK